MCNPYTLGHFSLSSEALLISVFWILHSHLFKFMLTFHFSDNAMLCYVMLCYAILCYAMLCYAMLCYAMLCYAMLLSYSVNLMLLSVNAYSVNAITVSVLFTWRELYFKKYSLCISVSYCALHLISYCTILFQTAALSILLHGEYMWYFFKWLVHHTSMSIELITSVS